MKVVLLTEGGKNIGFGHITRCTAIYQVFQERAVQSTFIINGDESVRQQFKGSSIGFDWLNNRESLFALIRDADIVFVDSYLADYDLYENISKMVKTAVYFDDEIRMNYPKGFVINGAIFAEQMPYPKRKGVTYLLGAQYAPLRKEFWDVPAKSIRDSIESVMITFGGADTRNLTPQILKLLVDTYPGLVKKVVIGKGFRNMSDIEAIKDHNTELIYYPDTAEMRKIMLESGIAISASGQTLYELARVGLPTVGICVAQNQLPNIEGFRKLGFLQYIGFHNDKNLEEKLNNSLMYLAAKCIRAQISTIGRKAIDGQGARRLLNYMSTTSVFNS